jgi:type IV pilus assembly protein PilV
MTPRHTLSRPRPQRGVTLIEALVSMLLFSMGVLALVGVQGSMVRAQTEAKVRADAAYLASEVVGKMWSDLKNVADYDGASCAGKSRCKEWQDKVAATLPNGTGTIAFDGSNNDVVVTIAWESPDQSAHRFVTHTTIIAAGS